MTSLEIRFTHQRSNVGWRRLRRIFPAVALLALAQAIAAAAPRPAACTRIELAGKVNAGQEWNAPIGEGWVFRVLPIRGAAPGTSGWDLAVDRETPAGFPDALLLATPPYNSINEREVGTTYGLRAQDAIGWTPRTFRFLTGPAAFIQGQKEFLALNRQLQGRSGASSPATGDPSMQALTQKLLELRAGSAAGEFRILDAGLTPGTADPAAFATGWALQSQRTPHTLESPSGGKSTSLGELHWIQFSITLWLPQGWKPPHGLAATHAPCQ